MKLQEVTVSLARIHKPPLEVKGFSFKECPGLAITESYESWDAVWPLPDRPWNVTHVPSGQLMASCKDKNHAEQVMADIAKLPVDWMASPEQIKITITLDALAAYTAIKVEAGRIKDEAEEAAFETLTDCPLVIEDLAPAPQKA